MIIDEYPESVVKSSSDLIEYKINLNTTIELRVVTFKVRYVIDDFNHGTELYKDSTT